MRRTPRFASALVMLGLVAAGLFAGGSANAATNRLEAENAVVSQGVVEANHAGYSGSGFVNGDNVSGSYTEWTVTAAAAGSSTLAIRYSNGPSTTRTANIAVNGTVVSANRAFNSTGNWDTWATVSITTNLNAGANKVRITAANADGNPNFDYIDATTPGGGGGTVTADQLLAKVTSCSQISSGKYKTDEDVSTATVPVCQKTGAVFWKADMDIDCDGVRTTQCNEDTDCCFYPDTACHTTGDSPLNSAALPYVVVPSSSSIWNYTSKGIGCGTVVAVIYNGKIEYAVVGDTGPTQIIGEASHKAASDLGIDPDPSTGGTDGPVTYVVFTGSGTKVSAVENHQQAVTLGQQLAQQFVSAN
ncbi:glycoside hydrolase family 75 protein [Planotetraspora kaengkrachanensis]|uniref:CBM6 domain-containing protein n=1 Tax=Planotetraspora kaengkrachanensis TaxID=575193 RepID=A0A8J3M202_9ACTN|nr:glycoside hydrolase family 75 protein [Planotetraspora kaengkrachanensis]GIG80728.1 hypothetical protein Pka01_38550 [Planotetraspora kaengkrachanensis]